MSLMTSQGRDMSGGPLSRRQPPSAVGLLARERVDGNRREPSRTVLVDALGVLSEGVVVLVRDCTVLHQDRLGGAILQPPFPAACQGRRPPASRLHAPTDRWAEIGRRRGRRLPSHAAFPRWPSGAQMGRAGPPVATTAARLPQSPQPADDGTGVLSLRSSVVG